VRVCLVEPGKIDSDHDARALHLTPVDDEELGRIEQRYETAASTGSWLAPTP
jgi:hypothetical protein